MNLKSSTESILEVLRKISNENLLSYQSLALTAEFMGIDSENHLFKQIPQTKVSIV